MRRRLINAAAQTAMVCSGLRFAHVGPTDMGHQSMTAPRYAPDKMPPKETLHGDAAYQEALKVRYQAQRDALELRLKQEKESVEDNKEKKGEKRLTLLNRMAQVHHDFGEFGEEKRFLEQLVEACIELKGTEHPMTVSAMAKLGLCLGRLDDFEAQLMLLEGLRDMLPRVYPRPQDASQVCIILHHLATAYENNSRIDDQIVTLTRIIDLQDSTVGPGAEPTAMTINKLAGAYGVLGHYSKQVELLENRIPVVISILGPTHPHVCISWLHLALAYGHVGRRADQLGLYEELEKVAVEAFGHDEHPFVLTIKRNRAVALAATNASNTTQCIEVLQLVMKNMDEALGPLDAESQATLHALAHTLAKAGRHADAIQRYDELMQRMLDAGLAADAESLEGVAQEKRRVVEAAAQKKTT